MGKIRDIVRRAKRLGRQAVGRDVRAGVQVRVRTRMMGSDYGGFVICPDGLSTESVVYSFGIGEEVSFDRAMIEAFGVTVNAFDPTPKSGGWVAAQELPDQFTFHPFGLADFDGTARFRPPDNPNHVSHAMVEGEDGPGSIEFPVKRLSTIMSDLGHDHVDILKMDIEGAEYDVFEDLAGAGGAVGQILVEFHHRFAHVGVERTQAAIETLNRAGFRIFHVSANGEEFGFIRQR